MDSTTEAERPVRLAGSLLREHRHVCAFFNSREDEYRVTLPFIKDGFACGDRAYHLIGSGRRDDHLERLTSAGIDTVTTRQTGQFELRDWDETYLNGGYFDLEGWMALLDEELANGPRRGFPHSRFIAHMEWALEDREGVDRLVEYEARVNYVRLKDVVICTYDLSRFRGDVVIDILRTHPVVIVGGILQQNPFYVEPDRFLEERRGRTAARTGSPPAGV